MADTTTELEVLDEIVDVLGGQSGQHETVVPVLEDIRDLLGGGGGGGGYNPSLSVGRADALTGADSTAQWMQRVTEGSGSATVRSVQGAAVAWNQLVNSNNISGNAAFATFTTNDGIIKATVTSVSGSAAFYAFSTLSSMNVGHKLLALFDIKVTSQVASVRTNFMYAAVATVGAADVPTNQWVRAGIISTLNTTVTSAYLYYDGYATLSQNDTVELKNYQVIDLTAMFGSGNEPSTVAEFEQMYPAAYYPYSAPTLKPVQISGIRSTDAQGGELDSVEWTAQTLRAAGTIRDMLYSDHVDVRVGVVDLGTLWWNKSEDARIDVGYYFYTQISDAKYNSANKECAKYTVVKNMTGLTNIIADYGANVNKILFSSSGSGAAYVIDSTYTTAADLKTSLAGVLLFYELATPTTQPISPALPMTYKVQAGGSESIIVPSGEISAAPILTVAEGESAADVVMDALACIATPDGPVATANHSVGTYLTMGGKLYKVTSAIAVGESITPNTNVSETTVMAELIARTA